jgi:hypothetical protein
MREILADWQEHQEKLPCTVDIGDIVMWHDWHVPKKVCDVMICDVDVLIQRCAMHMLCWLLESKERKWAKAAAKETNGQGNHKTVCKCLQTEITYDHLWSFMIIFIHFLFFELQHFCVWDEKTIDVTSGAVLFDFSPLFKNSSASGSNVGTWTGAREVLALSENSDRLSQISIRSSDLFFFLQRLESG